MRKWIYQKQLSVSRPSLLCLILGTYTVLCQLSMILLYASTTPDTVSTDVLRHIIIPWLEYPLMSLALVIGGAALLNYAERSGQTK